METQAYETDKIKFLEEPSASLFDLILFWDAEGLIDGSASGHKASYHGICEYATLHKKIFRDN